MDLQLDGKHHKGRHVHRPLKSSLKGSKSQLSLEEVAQAARRQAARKSARLKAQSTLDNLLRSFEQTRKVADSFDT